MTAHAQSIISDSVGLPAQWTEQYAGWIISLCLHLMLFSWMLSIDPIPTASKPPAEKKTVKVILASKPKPVEKKQQPKKEKVLQSSYKPLPARSTTSSKETSEIKPITRPVDKKKKNMPDQLERKSIADLLETLKKQPSALSQQVKGKNKEISKRLAFAENANRAAKYFKDYKGARVGALRTLDLSHPDQSVVQEVMKRYNIRMGRKYVETTGANYLNSAASGGSVFHPTNKAGFYQVFEISAQAHKKMVWLEENYIRHSGANPNMTRVDTVEFGIVRNEQGQWDLGIRDIKLQKITIPGADVRNKRL